MIMKMKILMLASVVLLATGCCAMHPSPSPSPSDSVGATIDKAHQSSSGNTDNPENPQNTNVVKKVNE